MGYARGVYRGRTFLPPLTRPKACTSRYIDGTTKRFKLDPDTGGFVGMPDTMQRVILLLAFEVDDFGDFSTDYARETWRRQAEKALRVLTRSSSPKITELKIVVTSGRAGLDEVSIDFIDALTGKAESVQL